MSLMNTSGESKWREVMKNDKHPRHNKIIRQWMRNSRSQHRDKKTISNCTLEKSSYNTNTAGKDEYPFTWGRGNTVPGSSSHGSEKEGRGREEARSLWESLFVWMMSLLRYPSIGWLPYFSVPNWFPFFFSQRGNRNPRRWWFHDPFPHIPFFPSTRRKRMVSLL